jgi:uncharacterized membrane protein YbhN (UPF0104 family)
VILLFAWRLPTAWLGSLARAMSRRWPSILSLDDPAARRDIQTTFDAALGQRGRLWSAFAAHLCCWYFGAAEVWLAFRLLGVDVTLWQALAVDATVAGLRTFGFMIPGAAGVQEASYLLAAAVFGIPPATAIAASLARRARDLVLAVAVLGIAVLADPSFAPLPALRAALHPPRRRPGGDQNG